MSNHHQSSSPFCTVPFVTAFVNDQGFKDCCARSSILSSPGQSFAHWWQDPRLVDFRKELDSFDTWPVGCDVCRIRENFDGTSTRLAQNQQIPKLQHHEWPRNWHIAFGNICNLGCWICSERYSSVIQQHKVKARIPLSIQYDPQKQFEQSWPTIKDQVLRSYEYHDEVTLTMLGGEPFVNDIVQEFLQELLELNLGARTVLHWHTNATVDPSRTMQHRSLSPWRYVCMFLSLDAVGPYAEWLRYGTKWKEVEKNVNVLKAVADYTEIHCTVSVLNINQLTELDQFARAHAVQLRLSTLTNPEFMNLACWDQSPDSLLITPTSEKFKIYYDLIGTAPVAGSSMLLKKHIRSFDKVRLPLASFDPDFARRIDW